MKSSILSAIFMLATCGLWAQDFAPIGAEWHYTEGFFMSGDKNFLKITSEKDTLYQGKACRKLLKTRIIWCNMRTETEFVYSENNAVFFWQSDLTGFQKLIDFNAEAGDSWAIQMNDMVIATDIDSVLIEVDSTSYIDINNQLLKVLYVTYRGYYDDEIEVQYSSQIVEKIGDMYYLFNFFPELGLACDGNYSEGLRCYEDEELGLYSTGIADSCTYIYHWTDIEEESKETIFIVYPNPTTDVVEINTNSQQNLVLEISDLTGRLISKYDFRSNMELDLSGLPDGIYLVKAIDGHRMEIKKIIKN
ncbi:MAG: hypothetical protein COW63_10000 [Bacteroidetes bacterium CG18_big_fil_WC_8_21_14_2_50_41_14]|nr:MAG: hypothetical protein COW63_10000 [Bacteroidetes bacterium CG18_big_fil_WC_8_21_14_2_50_41_14]PIY32475.1 MAG: hypothetical protein COZ08_07055 [Bacteroidetes bacterium CG_4_10_14_3_um_filter_42_6]PJB58991.1 MAG: hypothetical protein CO098_05760 [Bacteroidetes bacterium CG_4_9_14_3_um_filter_41_19]